MIKRYLALLLASAIFVSQSLFSEESITTGTIDVYSSSPLPSIGLPKKYGSSEYSNHKFK